MARPKRSDIDLLQGAWSIQALEMDGQAMPDGMLSGAQIVIEGDRFTTTGMSAGYGGTFEVDPTARPAHITMRFETGPEKGNTNLGIYELGKDTWKLCLATRGSVRPAAFATTLGSGFALETLSRAPAARPAAKDARTFAPPPPTGEVTEFEGEWPMVSGIMNGAAMDESTVKWVKRVTRGNQSTVMAGPQVMLKVEFTYDPTQSPKTIDYVNLAGAHKGKSQQGIYEFEGDVVKFCVAAPGDPRPTEFHSPSKSGLTYTTWKRP